MVGIGILYEDWTIAVWLIMLTIMTNSSVPDQKRDWSSSGTIGITSYKGW